MNKEVLEKINKYFIPGEPVQMSLREPIYSQETLPVLTQVEKHILTAIHAFLAGFKTGPELDFEILKEINEPSIYILSSEMFFKQNRFDEAVNAANEALRIVPQEPRALNYLSRALEKKGDFKGAVEAISKALEVWPDVPKFYHHLGRLLNASKKWVEAENALRVSLRLKPDLPFAYRELSVSLMHQDRLDEAIAAAEEAVRLKPDHPGIRKHLDKLHTKV